ncbi:hypothetical protein CBER1_10550 [Cercospora berteroae]|uniref:Protein kinase domain-containing protein n=1 Tax=Cercospora berteroae TaxID=357750 RepID=A0A2S6CJ08_9PEZI|nr:hypothetical protein CBER1_10550 [Cercospora berteroae]
MMDWRQTRDEMPFDVSTFALLRPTNAAAQLNFSTVAETLLHSQPPNAHHRRFIHIDPVQVPMRDPACSVPSSSDVEDEIPSQTPLIWYGHYVFSFAAAPLRLSSGWAIGFGQRSKDRDTGLVDVLLADSDGIRDSFAHFNFDLDGVFAISPRRSGVQIAGNAVRKNLWYTLSNPTALRLGACDYQLDFVVRTGDAEVEFQANKNVYLRQAEIALYNPHQASSATPTPFNEEVKGDWTIRAITGKTLQSVVKCAVRKTRTETAACKTLARNASTAAAIENEIRTYRTVSERLLNLRFNSSSHLHGRGRKFIRYIEQVYYSSGKQEWQNGKDDEVTIFWLPFGHCLLTDFCGRRMHSEAASETDRQTWLAQILLALQDFALIGFAHRDIKPGNILVINRSHGERHVSIIDLEQAVQIPTRGLDPDPGTWGTKRYIAPEAENAAYAERYSTQVDVFSAGIVGYELFVGEIPWRMPDTNPFRWVQPYAAEPIISDSLDDERTANSRVALKRFTDTLCEFETCPKGSVQNLLLQMLRADPLERITAAQALEHPFLLPTIRALEEDLLGHAGDKRRRAG